VPPSVPCPPVSGRTLRAPPPAPTLSRRLYSPVPPPMSLGVPWQAASAFNQPLSFDTSSLTDMSQMFLVRTPPHACRAKCPVGSSVHALRAPPPPPHAFAPCHPSRVALLMRLSVPRQSAWAFNQPLSFDTSGVTDTQGTSQVRTPRACRAQCPVGSSVHAACTATARTRVSPPVSPSSRPLCRPPHVP